MFASTTVGAHKNNGRNVLVKNIIHGVDHRGPSLSVIREVFDSADRTKEELQLPNGIVDDEQNENLALNEKNSFLSKRVQKKLTNVAAKPKSSNNFEGNRKGGKTRKTVEFEKKEPLDDLVDAAAHWKQEAAAKISNENRKPKSTEIASFITSQVNLNRAATNARINARKEARNNQQISTNRLARSKWRRDPIKERLLFLTGHGEAHVEDSDYVHHLERILAEKHSEKERMGTNALASLERDRAWFWRVKYDIDFDALEAASLAKHREERAIAMARAEGKQDAFFVAPTKQELYTIAPRTPGLNAERNIENVKKTHIDNMKQNMENGTGYCRLTRLSTLAERRDKELKEVIAATDCLDLYKQSEPVIGDVLTVDEQNEWDD